MVSSYAINFLYLDNSTYVTSSWLVITAWYSIVDEVCKELINLVNLSGTTTGADTRMTVVNEHQYTSQPYKNSV
jgi:hypothetical protein